MLLMLFLRLVEDLLIVLIFVHLPLMVLEPQMKVQLLLEVLAVV